MNEMKASTSAIQTSFWDYLEMLKPDVPAHLVSKSSFPRIRNLVTRLPGCLAFTPFGFECPLGDDAAEADFLFTLLKINSGPAILSGQQKGHNFDTSLLRIPQWRRVRRFGELWADPREPSFAGIDDVWMEFDIASVSAAHDVNAPSIFFGPFWSFRKPGLILPGADEAAQFLVTAFVHLNDRWPAEASIRNWKHCLEILPCMGILFQVGFMIARPDSNMLRMVVAVDDANTLKTFLNGVGWPGDFRNLEPVLENLSSFGLSFSLNLDVGETISGKIGIECRFPRRLAPTQEPRWFTFLDYLTGEGLCRPEKRNALLQYSGCIETDMHACPIPLRKMASRHFPLYRSFFVRIISHVKLVLDVSGEWKAKAYLGIKHFWKGLMGVNERANGPWGIIG